MAVTGGVEVQAASGATGYVDFLGYHAASRGWMFCGWIPVAAKDLASLMAETFHVEANFERGSVAGEATIANFMREDVADIGIGVVVHVPYSGQPLGRFVSVTLRSPQFNSQMAASIEAIQLREQDLVNRLRPILTSAYATAARGVLLNLLSRKGYAGEDTLGSLREKIFLEIDEVVMCPPHGMFIMGWMLCEPGAIVAMKLSSGLDFVELKPEEFVRIERNDVIEAMSGQTGFTDAKCGFITYIDNVAASETSPYLEIETRRKEIGFKNLPPAKLRGMNAIRRILDAFEARWADVVPTFDKVISPGIAALNAERLRQRPTPTVLQFGALAPAPRYTILVPLYGRMNFMEYQFALMSADMKAEEYDLIYVLDDPPKRQELENLAESIYERFKVPFRLVLLPQNLGFAPANNAGLAYARGEFLCFLNSDVFPETPDWMERLCVDLENNPDVGVVGPLLLFEDGSVQHEGMEFEPLAMFGGIPFPLHLRKGWRPRAQTGLTKQKAITGACMVLRTALAQELGGFDEMFIIGDFEDTDLCLKIRQKSLACAVDHDVRLFHLERKSQVAPSQRWRLNLTLHNAWSHCKRWPAESL